MDSPVFYAASALAILITGISKSGFGGAAMLAVPIMSISIPPFVAAGITLPIIILMDALSVAGHWRKWDQHQLKDLLPAAGVGVVVGAATASYANADATRLLVGILAVAFVLWSNRPAAKQRGQIKPMSRLSGRALGLFSGYTSFVAHAGAPPMHAYLLTQPIDKTVFTATAVLFFAIVNIIKVPAYLVTGLITQETLFYSLLLGPLAPVGVWIGLQLNKRLDPTVFFKVIHAVLLIVGFKLCFDGASGLTGLV